jgi:glycosyltransferase involved in cell wall biosynthesis
LLLSVIMPVRGAARTVQLALRSVLLALPRNSEVLVFLDGLLDEDLMAVSSIQDPRIRILGSQEAYGVAVALNALLDEAKGEFIARMDADDISLPWRFSHQIRKVRAGVDFHFMTAIVFGKKLRPFPVLPQVLSPMSDLELKRALTFMNPCVHPSLMARKSALAGLRYQSHAQEDLDLWLRAALSNFRMERSRIPGLLYRFHSKQVTASSAWSEMAKKESHISELRLKLFNALPSNEFGSIEMLRASLLRENLLLRLEFGGLPHWLKRWKNRGRA